jgi:hypothetical protein
MTEASLFSDPENPLALLPGATVWVRLDGLTVIGQWVGMADGWLHLDAVAGPMVLRPEAIAAMGTGTPPAVSPAEPRGGAPDADSNHQRQTKVMTSGSSKKSKKKAGTADATRPAIAPAPDPDTMRRIVGGFLDDQTDVDLAQRFGRPKREIQALRAAFECGRGNVVEDQLSNQAMAWLPALREALSE